MSEFFGKIRGNIRRNCITHNTILEYHKDIVDRIFHSIQPKVEADVLKTSESNISGRLDINLYEIIRSSHFYRELLSVTEEQAALFEVKLTGYDVSIYDETSLGMLCVAQKIKEYFETGGMKVTILEDHGSLFLGVSPKCYIGKLMLTVDVVSV